MKIININAISLDGKIAAHAHEDDAERRAYGFTNKTDQEFVRSQILEADAILTGANSVRASRKLWEQKNKRGKFPMWVIFTNSGLSFELPLWQQDHIPRVLVSKAKLALPPETKVENWLYGNNNFLDFTLEKLKSYGHKIVLLFGGGQINTEFYNRGLVDELKITVSPVILGLKDAAEFVLPNLLKTTELSLLSSQIAHNHVFLNYRIMNSVRK